MSPRIFIWHLYIKGYLHAYMSTVHTCTMRLAYAHLSPISLSLTWHQDKINSNQYVVVHRNKNGPSYFVCVSQYIWHFLWTDSLRLFHILKLVVDTLKLDFYELFWSVLWILALCVNGSYMRDWKADALISSLTQPCCIRPLRTTARTLMWLHDCATVPHCTVFSVARKH